MKLLGTAYKWLIVFFAFVMALVACDEMPKQADAKKQALAENRETLSGEHLKASEFMVYAADQSLDKIQKLQLTEGRTDNLALQTINTNLLIIQQEQITQLNKIAQIKGVMLPETPSLKHLKECETMVDYYKSDFDSMMTRWLTKELEKEIKRFEIEAAYNAWSILRQFAFDALPSLQNAFEQIMSLRAGHLRAVILKNETIINKERNHEKRKQEK